MVKGPRWGRTAKVKQKELPYTANDCCSGLKWSRYPAWTEAMRRVLEERRDPKHKWHSLIDRMYREDLLQSGWERLNARVSGKKRRRGAGVDGETVEQFSKRAEEAIPKLAEELREGRYRPQPARRHWIPKGGKRRGRPLGLLCIRDKVVEETLKGLIEPIFEREFLEGSHGFRPGRSTDTACRQLEGELEEGRVWVVDADIRSCFDEIDHEKLLDEVNRRVSDGKILKLIRSFLQAGILEEMKVRYETTGTPQGGILSPLLANIFLHALDERMQARGYTWVRYADDFVILCRTEEEAQAALKWLRSVLAEMGLALSESKTRSVHLEDGFDFLGWHYRGSQRWPREKSVKRLKAQLREKTRRNRPDPMERICQEVASPLRGWYVYYREGNSAAVMGKVSSWVRRRLRSILHRRRKGRGIGKQHLNFKWTKAHFEAWGFFDMSTQLYSYRYSHQRRA